MTSASSDLIRRVDRCVLAGDVPGFPVVPDGWLAVAVAPAVSVTASDLAAAVPPDAERVVLLAAGPLGPDLAVALDRPVVAPDGPVVQTPGGVMVTTDAGGGWWRHRPGRPAEPLGPRWPAPDWQGSAPLWPSTVIAQPVPAGWLLSPAPVGSAAAFDGVEFAVAVDPSRPRLLLDPALTGEQLALAMTALPTRVRRVADLVPLGAGQGAGRAVAATAAARLGEPVHLVNGVPLHTPAGSIVVFALDAHRRPVWAEPAWLLRLTPDGGEEVVASSPPHASLRELSPATYAMDMGWQVRLSGGGIHAFPGPPPPPAKGRASLPDAAPVTESFAAVDAGGSSAPASSPASFAERPGAYRVVVGTAGETIDDLVWPPLSAMFTALLSDIPAAVDLVVEGTSSAWGEAAERELAERHPGGGVTNGQARGFQRADLLPMPPAPLPPDPPAAARRARNGLALLAAAAVVVVLLAVAGLVAFWPRGGNGADLAGDAGPQTATTPDAAPGTPSAAASASGSASPRASTSASPRGSTQASASAAAGPSLTTSATGTPPLPLDTGTDVARGRPATESSHTDPYVASRTTDGDPMSYWESRNNAFPQWIQVDLGAPVAVRRIVLRLPPSSAWPARTQTVTVLGSPDGATFSVLVPGAACRFDPNSGQQATLTVNAGNHRYVRILISSNTVQPAGQLSAIELYRG
ncbi:discoidin domain-containing protein [Dactylosporangium sp. NPDC050588]|uniref:discoidin domain-containing protein n=1 Tax=Dactylosporangium sp. NPDC050588 TaxID=3157211 RepID=UPI0033F172E3